MPMMNNSNKKLKKLSLNGGTSTVIAICLVGIFVIGFIFLLAKGLFTSNSKEVPQGIDTATINTDKTNKTEKEDSLEEKDNSSQSDNNSSISGSDSSENSDSSEASAESGKKMYVTQYAYLHTKPDKNAENVVCMSPGVEVTVLSEEDNGYMKITFMNIDGELTGYIYKDYLASYNNQINNAESEAQNVQTDAYGGYNGNNGNNDNYGNGNNQNQW